MSYDPVLARPVCNPRSSISMIRISYLLSIITVLLWQPISAAAQSDNVDSQRLDRETVLRNFEQLQRKPIAAQEVALDAGVIIPLLQSQPALALQIKKLLIKD